MKNKLIKLYLILLISLISLGTFGADSYRLNSGETIVIDEQGTCKVVTNNSPNDYFVPTKTSSQWASFYNNLPSSVNAPACTSGPYNYTAWSTSSCNATNCTQTRAQTTCDYTFCTTLATSQTVPSYIASYSTGSWGSCAGSGGYTCTNSTSTGCSRSGTKTRTVSVASYDDSAPNATAPASSSACTQTTQGYIASYSSNYDSSWTCTASGTNGCYKNRTSYSAATFKSTSPNVSAPASKIYTTGYIASYSTGSWGSCSGSGGYTCTSATATGCSRSGTRTRSVSVASYDHTSPNATAPASSGACTQTTRGYIASYTYGSWGTCSGSCPSTSGTQTRTATAATWDNTSPNATATTSQSCTRTCGGGGGGGCFLAGTKIIMGNGSVKLIEEVSVGDEIMTRNKKVGVVKALKTYQHNGKKWAINGGRFFFTGNHPFMTTSGWKAIDNYFAMEEHPEMNFIGKLSIGDIVYTENGMEVIHSLDYELSNEPVYNFDVKGVNEYMADGYQVHNVEKN